MNNDVNNQTLLVNQANEAFLRGESEELSSKDEIFRNISLLLGLPYSLDSQRTYEIIGLSVFGLVFLFLGGGGLVLLILDPPNSIATENILKEFPIFVIIVLCLAVMVFDGYQKLRYAYFLAFPPLKRTETTYRKLTKTGVIIVGETIRDYRGAAYKSSIDYHFKNPSSKKIKGRYYTVTNRKIKAKDKVAVLYLSDKIHILL